MKFLSDDKEKLERLRGIVESWVNTPYQHWCGVKGEGCDCIHFVARSLEEMGYGPFTIPWYSKDWNLHNGAEVLLDGIREQLPHVEFDIEFSLDMPIDADIVLFRFGKVNSHAGIFFDGHVYQALNKARVERRHWKDKVWYKRRTKILRVLAL